jgi:hypothetical protein
MTEPKWIECRERLPEIGEVVETKIDDHAGVRNVQTLKLWAARLWGFPDDSMYVYYAPTHWRPLSS